MKIIIGLILIILMSGCLDIFKSEDIEEVCQRELGKEWHGANSGNTGMQKYCYKINSEDGREVRDIKPTGTGWELVEK